ncbi:MAG TPA: DUF5615 family PIN-like protein [Acidimicrobiales bacterium]
MSRLLLDENFSTRLVPRLRSQGHDVVHVSDVGLANRPDPVIMVWAAEHGRTVVTHDHDFLRHLSALGSRSPSVIKLAQRGAEGGGLAGTVAQAARLAQVLPRLTPRLPAGVAVTVDRNRLEIAPLPLDRSVPSRHQALERGRERRLAARDGGRHR